MTCSLAVVGSGRHFGLVRLSLAACLGLPKRLAGDAKNDARRRFTQSKIVKKRKIRLMASLVKDLKRLPEKLTLV